LRDLDLALGDDGAGQGGAEEVAAFVLGVGLRKVWGGREGGREGGSDKVICNETVLMKGEKNDICSHPIQKRLTYDKRDHFVHEKGKQEAARHDGGEGRSACCKQTHLMLTLTAQKTYSFTNSSRRSSMYTWC